MTTTFCSLVAMQSSGFAIAMPRKQAAPREIEFGFVQLDSRDGDDEVLSQDEIERASRIASRRERKRFRAGRTALRIALASRLEVEPDRIRFVYDELERPRVAGAEIQFNLAHADGWMLLAMCSDANLRLGVDIERLDASRDIKALLESTIAPRDAAALGDLRTSERLEAFYAVWVRYEACIKARSDGLVVPFEPLDQISQGLDVVEIPSPPGYVAALATDKTSWNVTPVRWPSAKHRAHRRIRRARA